MRTIYVVFKKQNNNLRTAKEYAFLCPYIDVMEGIVITSPDYDDPMMVTRVTNCSNPYQHGRRLKQIVISSRNSKSFTKPTDCRTITISKEDARKWYLSDNPTLKTLALSTYSKEELVLDFGYILRNTNHCTHTFITPIDSVPKNAVYHDLELIAKHFNGDWKKTTFNKGYFIGSTNHETMGFVVPKYKHIRIMEHTIVKYAGIVYFQHKEDVEKAIAILGDTVNRLFI